ncbi:MAG: hypothetical protein RL220_139 [Bacteroidota bacterium]
MFGALIQHNMYDILLSAHSILRWILLILMVVTIIDSLMRMYKPEDEADKKLALFSMIAMHLQVILGVVLYVVSPMVKAYMSGGKIMNDSVSRFWVVEHLVGMILAAILLTYGYSRSKKQVSHWARHRFIFVFYLVALIIILLMIPWTFREVGEGRGWI